MTLENRDEIKAKIEDRQREYRLLEDGKLLVVIPPFLTGRGGRTYAANFSFCAGVIPPMPILGLSLS
jgi:hypothetical protein